MLLGTAVWFPIALLPWMAGFVVLVALADACSVAMARRAGESYQRFMARVPLNGGPSAKAQGGKPSTRAQADRAEDWLALPPPDLRVRDAGLVLRASGSLSVWPFHGALLALLAGFYLHPPQVPTGAQLAARPGGAPATFPNQTITTTRTFTPANASQPGIPGKQPGTSGTTFKPVTPGQPGNFPSGVTGASGPGSTPPPKLPSTTVRVPIPPGTGPFSGSRTTPPPAPIPPADRSVGPATNGSGTAIPTTKPVPPQPGARPASASGGLLRATPPPSPILPADRGVGPTVPAAPAPPAGPVPASPAPGPESPKQ